MPFLKGEDINLGFAKEGTRGTYAAPTIYLPGRTPSGVKVAVDKTQIRETSGGGMGSTGAIVVQKRAEGDIEFNIRARSIGFLLYSLLGSKAVSTVTTDVYEHVFTLLQGNPQFPTLSLVLSQLGMQDYKYVRSLVKSMEIRTPVSDLPNATANFLSAEEATVTDVSVSFGDTDYYFLPQNVEIKIAADVAGLAAADPLALKDFSMSIDSNSRVNQNISEITPSDVLSLLTEITGSIVMDYTDETAHDAYVAGSYYAMSITMTRDDIDLGGGNNPSISIVLPRVSYEKHDPDRPIDDIVSEKIDFMAHYSADDGYGIEVTVVNDLASY